MMLMNATAPSGLAEMPAMTPHAQHEWEGLRIVLDRTLTKRQLTSRPLHSI